MSTEIWSQSDVHDLGENNELTEYLVQQHPLVDNILSSTFVLRLPDIVGSCIVGHLLAMLTLDRLTPNSTSLDNVLARDC